MSSLAPSARLLKWVQVIVVEGTIGSHRRDLMLIVVTSAPAAVPARIKIGFVALRGVKVEAVVMLICRRAPLPIVAWSVCVWIVATSLLVRISLLVVVVIHFDVRSKNPKLNLVNKRIFVAFTLNFIY